jgi:hypothetical protein
VINNGRIDKCFLRMVYFVIYTHLGTLDVHGDLLKTSALRYFYPCAAEAYYTYYTKATLPCTPCCPNYAAAVLRPQVFKTNSDPLGELHEYLPMPGRLCLTPRSRSQLVRDLIVAR